MWGLATIRGKSGPPDRATTSSHRPGSASLQEACFVSPSNRPRVRPLVERLLAPRRPLVVGAVAASVEVSFLALAGTNSSSELLLKIPGSGVSLIVMLAAMLAGPAVGIACALVGAVAFFRDETEIEGLLADIETASGGPVADDIALPLVRKQAAA
jgi:hypothetical protein